jgi:hypothetical protein
MADVDPADERRHTPDPSIPLWNESYYLDWFTEDLSLGGYVRIGFYPNIGKVWYWACLVGPDRPLVTLIDHDIPMPSDDQSMEIRQDGLWADHVVEDPVQHMSVNLEGFALSLDDPAVVYAELRGDRVPFGFQLDFLTDRAAYQWPPILPRYEIPCRVQGEVQVGDERIELDCWGQRDHSWGAARDWWSATWCWSEGRLEDGTRTHAVGGFLPDSDLGVAYVLPGGSDAMEEFDTVGVAVREGRERLPEQGELRFGGLDVTVTPVAFSPVGLIHPEDGRLTRFPRAMCRYEAADGRTGGGWVEWNQPPTGSA